MSTAILKYVLGAGVSCALAFSFANPSNAFPALTNTATVKSSMPSLVTDARYYRRGYGGRYYGRGYGYGGAAAGAIIGGAILGGLLAAPYYYGGGPYYYGPSTGSAVAYCLRRFKSYDPRSGTYLGYDGYRHPCP
jgi:BA14K-like protein